VHGSCRFDAISCFSARPIGTTCQVSELDCTSHASQHRLCPGRSCTAFLVPCHLTTQQHLLDSAYKVLLPPALHTPEYLRQDISSGSTSSSTPKHWLSLDMLRAYPLACCRGSQRSKCAAIVACTAAAAGCSLETAAKEIFKGAPTGSVCSPPHTSHFTRRAIAPAHCIAPSKTRR